MEMDRQTREKFSQYIGPLRVSSVPGSVYVARAHEKGGPRELEDAAARGLIPDSEFLLDGRWCWPAKVSIDYGREANADISCVLTDTKSKAYDFL